MATQTEAGPQQAVRASRRGPSAQTREVKSIFENHLRQPKHSDKQRAPHHRAQVVPDYEFEPPPQWEVERGSLSGEVPHGNCGGQYELAEGNEHCHPPQIHRENVDEEIQFGGAELYDFRLAPRDAGAVDQRNDPRTHGVHHHHCEVSEDSGPYHQLHERVEKYLAQGIKRPGAEFYDSYRQLDGFGFQQYHNGVDHREKADHEDPVQNGVRGGCVAVLRVQSAVASLAEQVVGGLVGAVQQVHYIEQQDLVGDDAESHQADTGVCL